MCLRKCMTRNYKCLMLIILCPLIILCVYSFINHILPRSISRMLSCVVVEQVERESHHRTNELYYNYHNASVQPVIYNVTQMRFMVPSKPCAVRNQPFLLVCILSSPSNKSFKLRQAIRNTWASNTYNGKVRFLFFVGRSKVSRKHIRMVEESDLHSDVVIIDHEDTYKQISYKSVSILKWSLKYCWKSKYIAKVDEDMFLDLPTLLLVLNSIQIPKVILGFVINEGRPNRDKNSKWYISKSIYKYEYYPVYISGATYVMSSDLLSGLLGAATQSPIIPNEDVYITGICGKKAGATLLGHCGFHISKNPVYMWSYKSYVNGHDYTTKDFQDIWNLKNTLFHANRNWLKYTSFLLM